MATNPLIANAAPMSAVPTTDIQAQAANLERQRRYAQMLMQQPQAQGQIVSGHFVGPAWTQQIQSLVNPILGSYVEKRADEQMLKLADQLRRQNAAEAEDIMRTWRGTPEKIIQAQATEANLPQGQTLVDDQGVSTLVPTRVAGVAPDLERAYAKAVGATGTIGQALAPVLAKELTKPPEWSTMTLIDQRNGNKLEYFWDKNSLNPMSTLRPIGTSSEAIPRGQLLEMIDKGILVPSVNNPYLNQSNAPTTPNAPTGGVTNAPAGGTTNVSAKPTEAKPTYGYQVPVPNNLPSNEARRDFMKTANKPLEGESLKTVSGAMSFQRALNDYQNTVNNMSVSDLANPQKRKILEEKHAKVILTGKEAYNLGVLNGGDERILNSIAPNYTDLSVFKGTIKSVADSQKAYARDKVLDVYKANQRNMPFDVATTLAPSKDEGVKVEGPKGKQYTDAEVLKMPAPKGVDPALWQYMPADKRRLWL